MPIFFWRFTQMSSDLMVLWHGPWSSVYPTRIKSGLCAVSQSCSFYSSGGSSSPGATYILGCRVGRQSNDTDPVLLLTSCSFHSKSSNYSSFFVYLCLDEIYSSRCTEASPKHNTPTTVFHCGDSVLCVVRLCLLSPRAPLPSNLTKGCASRMNNHFAGSPLQSLVWLEPVTST